MLQLLPHSAIRLLRKLLLHYGKRMDAQRMLEGSKRSAVQAVIRAARLSPAYRELLLEHGVDAGALGPHTAMTSLPILTKANTFERFKLEKLARPTAPNEVADVLTSSGRSGRSFGFRLTGRDLHETSWFDIDLGLQDMFGVDQTPTLLVNCLPMGVIFSSHAVCVANVSVREDMACSILRDVGPRYAQTIVCTDPLFIRALLQEAKQAGVDWKALNTSVILGEEVLVEAQRDYIAARMGIDLDRDPQRMIGSSFGVGELGLNLLFESRETIRMRRAMRHIPELAQLLGGTHGGASAPSVFCYNPMRSYIEVLDPDAEGFGELCITMLDRNSVIPLPRYSTGDVGKLVSAADAARAAELAGTSLPWLPVACVKGRIKDRPKGMPSVEAVKELIYSDHGVADQLSGAFRIEQDEAGAVSVTLQAHSDAAANDGELLQSLQALLNKDPAMPLSVELLAPLAFPWRPLLDHERKFAYMGTTR